MNADELMPPPLDLGALDPVEQQAFEDLIQVDEMAADFIEHEVGRNDWIANWKLIKATRNPHDMIDSWLTQFNLQGDSSTISSHIDGLTQKYPVGRWR